MRRREKGFNRYQRAKTKWRRGDNHQIKKTEVHPPWWYYQEWKTKTSKNATSSTSRSCTKQKAAKKNNKKSKTSNELMQNNSEITDDTSTSETEHQKTLNTISEENSSQNESSDSSPTIKDKKSQKKKPPINKINQNVKKKAWEEKNDKTKTQNNDTSIRKKNVRKPVRMDVYFPKNVKNKIITRFPKRTKKPSTRSLGPHAIQPCQKKQSKKYPYLQSKTSNNIQVYNVQHNVSHPHVVKKSMKQHGEKKQYEKTDSHDHTHVSKSLGNFVFEGVLNASKSSL
jgi:hypothetical protein